MGCCSTKPEEDFKIFDRYRRNIVPAQEAINVEHSLLHVSNKNRGNIFLDNVSFEHVNDEYDDIINNT